LVNEVKKGEWAGVFLLYLPVFILLGPLVIGLGLSVAFYSVVNPLLQPTVWKTFLQNELGTGVIGLRISSILVGTRAVWAAYKHFDHQWSYRTSSYQDKRDPHIEKLPLKVKPEDLNTLIVSQLGFYLTIIIMLWAFVLLDRHSIWISIVSWSLFFIVDDWIVISDVMWLLKGRVLFWHSLRIWAFNILLAILCGYSLYKEFGGIPTLCYSILLVILMFTRTLMAAWEEKISDDETQSRHAHT
jgi:hypothetical protein